MPILLFVPLVVVVLYRAYKQAKERERDEEWKKEFPELYERKEYKPIIFDYIDDWKDEESTERTMKRIEEEEKKRQQELDEYLEEYIKKMKEKEQQTGGGK